jgi:hypothetical protein
VNKLFDVNSQLEEGTAALRKAVHPFAYPKEPAS